MAINRKAQRNANSRLMAGVLNVTACDLRNPLECRAQLKLNGFTDEQIDDRMADAQHIARILRATEIDQLARKQWD